MGVTLQSFYILELKPEAFFCKLVLLKCLIGLYRCNLVRQGILGKGHILGVSYQESILDMQCLKDLLDNQGKSGCMYSFGSGKALGLEVKISASASMWHFPVSFS